MTSEQIRVSEEQWTELNSHKRPGESFSDVIDRLLGVDKEPVEENDELARVYYDAKEVDESLGLDCEPIDAHMIGRKVCFVVVDDE